MLKIEQLLENLRNAAQKDRIVVKEGEDTYKVNVLTKSVASVYEKLRTFIDYNDEHLLRKNAIYRILKRRFIEPSDIGKVSENILKELISAGYLPNQQIPESMKLVIAEIITKYNLLFEEILSRKGFLKNALKQYRWLLSLAAVEIEEKLVPASKERVYAKFLFDECKRKFEIEYPEIDEKTMELYLYIAVNRCLIKSDRKMLNFFLLRLFYPSWKSNYEEIIPYIAENIEDIKDQIDAPIDTKLVNKLIKRVSRMAVMTRTIRDVIESHETDVSQLNDEHYLEERIKKVIGEKNKLIKKKVRVSLTRAIFYVMITKMLLALAIEVPLDKYFYGSVHLISVIINVTFPVVLMIIIGLSIKVPGDKNVTAMTEGIFEMLGMNEVKQEYIRPEKKRSGLMRAMFKIIYVIVFIIPFYIIINLLLALKFSALSILLFLVFLCIVSFFGVRIRQQVKDLDVTIKKETIRAEFVEFFTMPILRLGKWLSLNFSRVNVFALFLDIFIEAPLKLFLQVLDEWFGFVKEHKEDF